MCNMYAVCTSHEFFSVFDKCWENLYHAQASAISMNWISSVTDKVPNIYITCCLRLKIVLAVIRFDWTSIRCWFEFRLKYFFFFKFLIGSVRASIVYSFIHFNFMFPFFHSYMVIVIVMLRLLLSSFWSHSQNSFKTASRCARGCFKVYLFKHFGLVYKILNKCCLYLIS